MTLFIIMVTITSLKDRTVAEQEERRKLVSELRQKIASEPLKKWPWLMVIRFEKIESVGDFTKK